MKTIRHWGLLIAIALIIPKISAQTNSVELKDGTGTIISSHSGISDALAAIPTTLTQGYTIELTATYDASTETFPIVFSQRTGASSTNTITVQPALGVTAMQIAHTNQIFNFNGGDYIIIDGRPGGIGNQSELTIFNSSTGANNTMQFINGATHNTIRYCTITHNSTYGTGIALLIGTSNNASGNSDIIVENCTFPKGRYRIHVNGTAANPNKNIQIKKCDFTNVWFVGVWFQSNITTGLIDSCTFQNTTTSGDGGYFAIIEGSYDTITVRNNTFKDFQNAIQSTKASAITVRNSQSLIGKLSRIYNNFISFENGNAGASNLHGILFEGTGSTPLVSQVYNNTIKMSGTMNNIGTSGNVVSSCVTIMTTNAASNVDFKNNIFINNRTGGNAGVVHTCLNYAQANHIINSDYNTYNSVQGNLVRHTTNNYNTLATWQAFVPAGNEQNSNTSLVQTVSNSDLHLTGTSIGDATLVGTPIAYITTDIDGQQRSAPYRGADESDPFQSTCSGNPGAGITQATQTQVCLNGTTDLSISGIFTTIPDLNFQWQTSPDNITYTNITGANSNTYQATITSDIWYRVYVTCATSGLTDTMAPVQIQLLNTPTATGITSTNTSNTYTFTATGISAPVTSYLWDLGNGTTSTLANPIVTYTVGGSINVSVTLTNACGSNTIQETIIIGCNGTPPNTSTLSSILSGCNNDALMLTLSGITGSSLGYTYQWESSTDGINFTPINGETTDILNTTLQQNTYYRNVVTCTYSNLNTPSTPIEVELLPSAVVTGISTTNTSNLYTFTATGITGNPTSYFWDFGDGITSTVISPSHSYAAPGNYTVKVKVTNSCGSDSTTINITIGCTGPAPAAQIISSATDVCPGDPITLSLTGLNAQEALTYTYQWQSSIDGNTFNNIAGATNNTYSTTVTNIKYYRCLITCAQNTATPSQPIALNLQFVPTGTTINKIVNGNTYIFSLGLIGTYTYAWDFGDGATSTLTNPSHTYTTNGIFTVSVVVTGPCGNDTLTTTVASTVSLESHTVDLGINLYPNPTNDVFVLESNTTQSINRIKIIDMIGKTVYLNETGTSLPISISSQSLHLQPGIYFIELSSQNITNTFKLIVN